ncbi:MAG TPA: helix-hairpin-helix domain-containing protein [Candidatus Defluviicoccus seviourii]|nr:helix-hairpin-helix domain-containing protein [Candidatus Defluviicoccus seviourii]
MIERKVQDRPVNPELTLANLRNVGKATLRDFHLLGIFTIQELAGQNPLDLYRRLCDLTDVRQDPCVEDVFAAAVHQAQTGEALDWWVFTPARKARTNAVAPVRRSPAR